MAKPKNPPCIRNLDRFKKTGCPQCLWDGVAGCPAWVEMITADPDNPAKQRTEKKCIDLWTFQFTWAQLGLLEGNQQAIESFRNGMVYQAADGSTQPKPDPALVQLVNMAAGKMQLPG